MVKVVDRMSTRHLSRETSGSIGEKYVTICSRAHSWRCARIYSDDNSSTVAIQGELALGWEIEFLLYRTSVHS